MATPTMNRNPGKTTSVMVYPSTPLPDVLEPGGGQAHPRDVVHEDHDQDVQAAEGIQARQPGGFRRTDFCSHGASSERDIPGI